MIRSALPVLMVGCAMATGLAVASEWHAATGARPVQVVAALHADELAAMARAEAAVPVAAGPVVLAPRRVPLPPRRAAGL